MKVIEVVLFLVGVAYAEDSVVDDNPVFNYAEKYGIPLAEKIRETEEAISESRIIDGRPSALGQFEFQAGLLISFVRLRGRGVCGASLVTANRLITAAHCWNDGRNQAFRFTVVLGSVYLYTGGTRIDTSEVVVHPNWSPRLFRSDIAIIYLGTPVTFSEFIGPIALPQGVELEENFEGDRAIASGFGRTADGARISPSQSLSYVSLNIISNRVCSSSFPSILRVTNICTSGFSGDGTCQGDSGGPLFITRGSRRILVGVTAFGSRLGCESFMPAVYTRVTSFIAFITQNL